MANRPTKLIFAFLGAVLCASPVLLPADAAAQGRVRIKDIADFEGVRQNMLVGYGLVVGLNGTGDTIANAPFTQQSIIGMLERMGVNTRDISSTLRTKNVAAVMVTGTLPAFGRTGTRMDVSIGALGDATNLMGGTLLVTPMLGADGEVYAVAQGPVAISGFAASGAGQSVTRGTPTGGRVANGAIIEREVTFELSSLEVVNVTLRNPDFTTARRIAQAISAFAGVPVARARDPGTVLVMAPPNRRNDMIGFLTDIEQLQIQPDQMARVVIDEKSGTIVMGENVRISTVAIAQGNLTIRITETPQVSQPNPFSSTGTTTTVNRTDIQVDEGTGRNLAVLPGSVTLQELVNGLNALGITPRDMITILQAIKAAGALQAEISVL
ncbi:MAG: flagellar basal body P-ring protein FlgI [Magnetospirillum sp.]|jgi:flagellar P-ring protein precursor FlgI|nr:flagellar basal body P-ring protein FlgI [Magnetospirillum sp.]